MQQGYREETFSMHELGTTVKPKKPAPYPSYRATYSNIQQHGGTNNDTDWT
jgi:hypothetical protein